MVNLCARLHARDALRAGLGACGTVGACMCA